MFIEALYVKFYQKLWRGLRTHFSHKQAGQLLSKVVCTSGIIDKSWAIHKFLNRKPDCKDVKSFFTYKMVKQRIIDYSFKCFAGDRK